MLMIALGGQFFGIDKAKRRYKNAPPVHAGNRLAATIIILVRLELPSRPLHHLCPFWSPLQIPPPQPTSTQIKARTPHKAVSCMCIHPLIGFQWNGIVFSRTLVKPPISKLNRAQPLFMCRSCNHEDLPV